MSTSTTRTGDTHLITSDHLIDEDEINYYTTTTTDNKNPKLFLSLLYNPFWEIPFESLFFTPFMEGCEKWEYGKRVNLQTRINCRVHGIQANGHRMIKKTVERDTLTKVNHPNPNRIHLIFRFLLSVVVVV